MQAPRQRRGRFLRRTCLPERFGLSHCGCEVHLQSWQLAQGLGFAPNIPLPTEDTRTLMNVLGEQFNLPPERMLIMEGSPKHKIIETVHDLQIDLLLIGAPSNQFLQGEMTHTSHYVIDNAPCDVLLMRTR